MRNNRKSPHFVKDAKVLTYLTGRLAVIERGDPSRGNFERQAATLEARLVEAGRCRCCGRELTDPDSLARGIGPTCLAKPR